MNQLNDAFNNEIQLKKSVISGATWKLLERLCAQGVSLIVSIIIARMLVPSDYSVVSIVAIFFSFANIFITGGLNTALIQKKEANNVDYSSVLFLSILISVITYFSFFLFS